MYVISDEVTFKLSKKLLTSKEKVCASPPYSATVDGVVSFGLSKQKFFAVVALVPTSVPTDFALERGVANTNVIARKITKIIEKYSFL